ncbi:MAG: hypothetical protein KGM91_24720, partial [Burkholderiales bacterium]|nr:hypothetical protein [Burkholderiales bacterium]
MNQQSPEKIARDAKPWGPESAPRLPDEGRRRLFRGVGGAGGVLLAVSAKTALGGTVCQSPSATMSGNTSPRPGNGTTCSGGLSPGYWVQPQHSLAWPPAGGVFPTFSTPISACSTGSLNSVAFTDITNPGTVLQTVFTGWAPVGTTASVSMWWVMQSPNDAMFGGPGGIGQLLRHLSAAWLSAGYYQGSTAKYPLTQAQVVDMWVQLHATGVYCPQSMKTPGGGCASTAWTASQVISYISGMYDINAPTT